MWPVTFTKNSGQPPGPQERSCRGAVKSLNTVRSVAKSVGCFQRCLSVCLFVCVFVCQHDNFQTSKHRTMKLGGRCVVQKSRPSSNLGVKPPSGCAPHPPKWRWATTLGKSAQAVCLVWKQFEDRTFLHECLPADSVRLINIQYLWILF